MHEVEGPFAVRRLSKPVVLGAAGIHLLFLIAWNTVLFRSNAVVAVVNETGGWVSQALIFAVAGVLVFCSVIGLLGGARACDLGLRRAHVVPAVVVTIAVWLLLNGAHAFVLYRDDGLSLTPWFTELGGWHVTEPPGILGSALQEELIFRGCLLAQVAWWLTPTGRAPARREVLLATLWTQVWFALIHIPMRLALGGWRNWDHAALDLLILWVLGSFFAAVWLRTGNLLVAAGCHALNNLACLLVAGDRGGHPIVMVSVMLVLIAFGPRWKWLRGGAGRAVGE